jgi:endonuclease YncB( thermonuclease family)
MRSELKAGLVALAMIAVFAVSSHAQSYLPGQVIDVLDGRTMVLVVGNGKITIQLDYIEVPATGQPMSDSVKTHLIKLVSKRAVQYRPRLISADRTIGRVVVNGVDISQQMLRDGAAWHMPMRLSGQAPDEHAAFDSLQQAAKRDQLGIWAVANMKPSWEQTSEPAVARKPVPAPRVEPGYGRQATKIRPGKWGDVNPKLGDVGAIFNGYNAESKTGFLTTGLAQVDLTKRPDDGPYQNAKLFVDITYWYQETASGRTGTFVLTLISENDTAMFDRQQDLHLITETGKVVIGRGKRQESRSGGKVFEKLTFNISRAHMERLTGDVTLMKIADHMLEPQVIRYILYTMLQSA